MKLKVSTVSCLDSTSTMNRSYRATRYAVAGGVALLCVLLTTACGGRLQGTVDYDRELDFSTIKTLAFYEDAYPLARKQTEARRMIRAEIEQVLRDRGYGFARAGEADLLIVYHVGTRAKIPLGSMTGSKDVEASLAIAFQDPVTRRSAWYGTVEQTWSDQLDLGERVDAAVQLLLENFPPPVDSSRGEQRILE